MSAHEEDTIRIERRFAHPVERVFAAFSQAAAISSWLSPADDIELRVERFHFAPEGEFHFLYLMQAPSSASVAGRFLVIEPPNRLSFTWEWQPPDVHAGIESHVSIVIEPHGDGSLLTLEHRRLTGADMARRHHAGWAGAFDRLENLLPSHEGKPSWPH